MKTVRGGHNLQAIGAHGFIKEEIESRKIKDSVIKYLRQGSEKTEDGTPGNMGSTPDLRHGVNVANNNGSDMFISIHFNSCKGTRNEAIGTETLVYSKSFPAADRVQSNLTKLGFKNRGVKSKGNSLYELRATNMKSMIVEICFVNSKADVDLYNKLGVDKIGKAIAEGILGKTISGSDDSQGTSKPVPPKPVPKNQNMVKIQKLAGTVADGIWGKNTEAAVKRLPLAGYKYVTRKEARVIQDILGIVVDGIFGRGTEKAVKEFQKAKRLGVDGVVGFNTYKALAHK